MTEPIIVATQEQIASIVRDVFRAEAATLTGNGPKEVLTLEEAAELLGRSPKTLMRLATEEGLPAYAISEREPRFFRSELLQWLRTRQPKPKELGT